MVAPLFVGLGGFAGAVARHVVDRRLITSSGGALPWGTFIVNVSGQVLLGLLFAARRGRVGWVMRVDSMDRVNFP